MYRLHLLNMKMKVSPSLALILLAACSSHPHKPATDHGLVRANIEGAFSLNYEGAGVFTESRVGQRPGSGEPLTEPGAAFRIFSEGTGSSKGYSVWFLFRAPRPEVGMYRLERIDGKVGNFTAFVFDDLSRIEQSFSASSGTLRITSTSADQVEGNFRMTAFRFCTHQAGHQLWCKHPQRYPSEDYSNQPQIVVEGTFTAVYKPPEITIGTFSRD